MAGKVETWRNSFMASSMKFAIPGSVVAASRGDEAVVALGSGDAVLGSEPMRADAAFHIGSMSKLFTLALIMQLDQERSLSLADTVDRWFPTAPNASRITVQMLVQHTGGLGDIDESLAGTVSLDDLIASGLKQSPVFEPGTAYTYNNNGYLMLGQIAEKATGRPYQDLVQERFIAPLGLTQTYLNGYGTGPQALNGYELTCAEGTDDACDGKPSTPKAVDSSPQWKGAWSAGGFVSTASDQTRWIRALVTGTVVDDAHRSLMRTLTPQSASYYDDLYQKAKIPPVMVGEGTGLAIWRVPGVGDCLGHAGAIPGANGMAAYCPDKDVAITVLSNMNPAGTSPGYPGVVDLTPPAVQALGG